MSIWATDWAWRQDANTAEKLILLALASFADKEGVCYPGQTKLASMTKMTSRSVRTHLVALETRDVIKRTARWREDGTRNSDIFQLVGQPEDFAGREGANRKISTGQPENSGMQQPENFAADLCQGSNPSENTSEDLVALTPEDLIEAWNTQCGEVGLPKVLVLTSARRTKALLRLREHPDVEFWSDIFWRIRKSSFLLGNRHTNGHEHWTASFDWLMKNDTNIVKVSEGQYDDKAHPNQTYLGR